MEKFSPLAGGVQPPNQLGDRRRRHTVVHQPVEQRPGVHAPDALHVGVEDDRLSENTATMWRSWPS